MNPFLAVVDLQGAPLGMDAITRALPALTQSEGRIEVVVDGCWASAWVPSVEFGRPAVAQRHGVLAIGDVRLTNRADLIRGPKDAFAERSDLSLVIDHYLRFGTSGVRDLLGSFAFVIWDPRQEQLFAARDALGTKTLFYQQRGRRLAVASHLDCLELTDYDRSFIGHFLIGTPSPTTRTIFSGVHRLQAGSTLVARSNQVTTRTYWSPAEFGPTDQPVDPRQAAEEFRALFTQAVAAELDSERPTWAQLSGGLDSSSVVGMASRLAEQGRARPLGGTLTVVDSLSEGDETRYSNAVAAQYGLRNETLTDYWAWQDDAIGPPRYTEPHEFFPFYTRDREMCRRAKAAGARVLLSGQGADHYLSGRFEFAADLLVKRRYREAVDHLLNVAVTTRQSFWRTAFYHGLYHLAPSWLKRRYRPEGAETPSWLTPELVGAEGLDHRMLRLDQPATGYGFFADTCATEVASIDLSLTRGLFEEGLELRYPFLHRPLVEFGLRLPATMRARPHQQKWILREAMGNVLPDVVRARQGKGGVDGRITWSLNREQPLLRRLILDSHLADLGCVRQEELKQAFDNAVAGNTRSVGLLFVTLSLETWLAVRSGRWSRSRSSQPLMSQGVPASDAQIRKGSSNAIEAVVH